MPTSDEQPGSPSTTPATPATPIAPSVPPKPPQVGPEIITKGADPRGVERKVLGIPEKRSGD